jgi:hypothetical protein
LSIIPLRWSIMFGDLHFLKEMCHPGMHPTRSWWLPFWYAVKFGLLVICWGFLNQHKLGISACTFVFYCCILSYIGNVRLAYFR